MVGSGIYGRYLRVVTMVLKLPTCFLFVCDISSCTETGWNWKIFFKLLQKKSCWNTPWKLHRLNLSNMSRKFHLPWSNKFVYDRLLVFRGCPPQLFRKKRKDVSTLMCSLGKVSLLLQAALSFVSVRGSIRRQRCFVAGWCWWLVCFFSGSCYSAWFQGISAKKEKKKVSKNVVHFTSEKQLTFSLFPL